MIVVITAWELLVWIPVDVISSLQVFDLGRVGLVTIHAVIGLTGIFIFRRLPAN